MNMPVEPNMYDDEELVRMRASQNDPIAMYIIVKKSLKMSPGKMAAQVAHGAQMILIRYYELLKNDDGSLENFRKCASMGVWIKKSFRKIVLKASDAEFERAKNELNCVVVRDAGLTELDPKTETVVCTWPMKKSKCPKFLTRLRVL